MLDLVDFGQKHFSKVVITSVLAAAIVSIAFRHTDARLDASSAGKSPITTVAQNARLYFPQQSELRRAFTQLYTQQAGQLIWMTKDSISAQLDSLIGVLQHAADDGLVPEEYQLTYLQQLREKARQPMELEESLVLDYSATAACLQYASDVYFGRIHPQTLDSLWQPTAKQLVLADYISQALQQKRLRQSLMHLLPSDPAYRELKTHLAKLRTIEQTGGWHPVPTQQRLAKSDTGLAVLALRCRLTAEGDLSSQLLADSSRTFDEPLAHALSQYQQRNGLVITGSLTRQTRQCLQLPVAARIRQIEINLERMRWRTSTQAETKLCINLPDYTLRVIRHNRAVWQTHVVVGKPGNPTPVFSDTLESIVFSPEWNVPQAIAIRELLPLLQKTPWLLERNHYQIYESWRSDARLVNPYAIDWKKVTPTHFPYRIAQKPGTENALGAVKFVFPNAFDVYLHDTPAKELFKETNRAYSHGCVRVENPLYLAYYLLRTIKNHPTERTSPEASEKTVLTGIVEVQTVYQTAFVENGLLHFRDDIYSYDLRHGTALRTRNNHV